MRKEALKCFETSRALLLAIPSEPKYIPKSVRMDLIAYAEQVQILASMIERQLRGRNAKANKRMLYV